MVTAGFSRRRLVGFSLLVLFLGVAVGAGISACGTDASPVSARSGTSPPGGSFLLGFSPEARAPAAKLAIIPAEGKTVSEVIGPNGGKLRIQDTGKGGVGDNLSVTLVIPRKALIEATTITMKVYGNTLSQLIVAFEPTGLQFLKAAVVEIRLGGELVDIPVDKLTAWYEHDGTVGEAPLYSAEYSGWSLEIVVGVPGFSRYGVQNSL